MNERDRVNATSTWPPPQLANEKGNDDETVVVRVSHNLLQLLFDPGSAVLDEPAPDNEERSK